MQSWSKRNIKGGVGFGLVFVLVCLVTRSSLKSEDVRRRLQLELRGRSFGGGDGTCAAAPLVPEDRRKDKNKLRVVTFNAEYLFYDTSVGCDKRWQGCPWRTAEEARNHLEMVARQLSLLDADIINLVEVRSCFELQEVANILSSGYIPYLVDGCDTATGQNVGILTRIDPIKDLWRTENRESYPSQSLPRVPSREPPFHTNGTTQCMYTGAPGTQGVSKHYVAEFHIRNDLILAVIGVHFLAGQSPERCAMKEAQAVVIRSLVVDMLAAGRQVIVLGDFNDVDYQVFLPAQLEMEGSRSATLDILRHSIPWSDTAKAGCIDVPFVNFGQGTARSASAWYDANSNCIIDTDELVWLDHILVSDSIVRAVKSSSVSADFGAFVKPQCRGEGDYVSDHFPVVVDFDFQMWKPNTAGDAYYDTYLPCYMDRVVNI